MLTADLILPPALDPIGPRDSVTGDFPGLWVVSNSILREGRTVIGLTSVPGTLGPERVYFQAKVNGVWGNIITSSGAPLVVLIRNQGIGPQADFYPLADPIWALLPDEIRVRAYMTDAFGAPLPAGTGATVTLLFAPAAALTLDDLNAATASIVAALNMVTSNAAATAEANTAMIAAAVATIVAAVNAAKVAIIAAIPGNHQH